MIKALDAFVQQVDEHSHFLGPEDYKRSHVNDTR